MAAPIQQMSLSDYADLQSRAGVKVIERNGRFWRQVRPYFYRPLLPVEGIGEAAMPSPVGWPGGFQYAVAPGRPANSTMNFVMLDDLRSYSLEILLHKRRQLIKRAAQQFQIRRIVNADEAKAQGHQVYLSFYARTGYSYNSARRRKAVFDSWVDTLFSNPKTIVLGGYGENGLSAISTSYWVNQTFVYATLLCEATAMHKNLGELMFHEVRLLAGQEPGINEIYVRPYQGGNSLDKYYLLRGCRLVRMPARLELPSSIRRVIQWALPRQYRQLSGED